MARSQSAFSYTNEQLTTVAKFISQARLLFYYGNVRKYENDEDRLRQAIALYERNTFFSEVMYTVVQGFEVTLRNAIHNRLKADHASDSWYEKLGLRKIERESVEKAKRDLEAKAQQITPDRLVGELSFGFWVGLLSRGYEDLLWVPSLAKIFPATVTRGALYSRLKDMKTFRNRIAHHNRIIGRPQTIRATYDLFLETIHWLDPTMHSWVAATNRADERLPRPIFQRPRPALATAEVEPSQSAAAATNEPSLDLKDGRDQQASESK